jgi:hypothetical protein
LTGIGEADVVRKNRSVQTQGNQPGAANRGDRRRKMTTTTTGTNGFPVRYIVIAVVAAALAAVIIAISQQAGTDAQQTAVASSQATTEVAVSSANTSGLAEAFANGKLDEGLGSADTSAGTVSTAQPRIVEVAGHGPSYDALLAGKFGVDFGPSAAVRYVRAPGEASGGLTQELATVDPENVVAPVVSAVQPRTVELAGQGSSYDALIAGKFTEDFGPNAHVRYMSTPQTVRGGLWNALDDGKLDDSVAEVQPSIPPTHSSGVSGGPQE